MYIPHELALPESESHYRLTFICFSWSMECHGIQVESLFRAKGTGIVERETEGRKSCFKERDRVWKLGGGRIDRVSR